MREPLPIAPVRFNPPQGDGRDVEALSIDDLRGRIPEGLRHRPQRADFFRLLGVTEGTSQPVVDFIEYPSRPMHWMLVRPGQVFRYDFSSDWSGWLLVFRPEALRPPARGYAVGDIELQARLETLPTQLALDPFQHDWMAQGLNQMQIDGRDASDAVAHKELLRLQLRLILWRLALWQSRPVEMHPAQAQVKERYARFVRLLEARFATDHQVGQYAEALGMSEKTLGRVCLAAAGTAPKALIAQRLALEARRLLAHTPMTVQSMALELGFVDATHFAKFFRREVGMSAQAFRRSQR